MTSDKLDSGSPSTPPRLFISYCWSSPEHETWVVELATQLTNSRVDVILDKWALREGQDAHAFMERMVNDPTVNKVIMVFDRKYRDKANDRDGGVGTETQIITPELYSKKDQTRFVGVIAERDVDGGVPTPTYYNTRIFIDLSDPSHYAKNYDQLERWIYDKPLYVKPELGDKPRFLDDPESIQLGTSGTFHRAIKAVRDGEKKSPSLVRDYFESFVSGMSAFRVDYQKGDGEQLFSDAVDKFRPHRDQFIDLVQATSRYEPDRYVENLQMFFEGAIQYFYPPEGVLSWNQLEFDNMKFIVHELFLYCVCLMLREKRFTELDELLSYSFFPPKRAREEGHSTMEYTVMRNHLDTLVKASNGRQRRFLSPAGELLRERCASTKVDFEELMQADFVLWLRTRLNEQAFSRGWWPDTLVYRGRLSSSFEVFARATSRRFYDRLKPLFLGLSAEDLIGKVKEIEQNERGVPRWEFTTFVPSVCINAEGLAKTP